MSSARSEESGIERSHPDTGAWSRAARRGLFLALLLAFSAMGPVSAQFSEQTMVDGAEFSGIAYFGAEGARNLGTALASGGDLDGDGRPDLLIGADGAGEVPGSVFITLAGGRGPLRRNLPGDREAALEIRTGLAVQDRFGYFVSAAGDVDGDGISDWLAGAEVEGHALFSRGVFLIFGSEHGPPVLELTAEPDRAVFFALEEPGPPLGFSGAGTGDLNGDGFDDFALGLEGGFTDSGGRPLRTGKVFVILGGASLRTGPRIIDLTAVSPPVGFEISGVEADGGLGAAVAGAGDVNGDGFPDLAIGAPGHGNGGSVFLVLGKSGLSSGPDLSAPDIESAIEVRSTFARSRLGEAIAGGADATGDGAPDLVLGAPGAEREGAAAGFVFVLAGGAGLRDSSVVELPRAGAAFLRGLRGSSAGSSVALVPDLNADGSAEVLVGAPLHRGGRGAAYLIYGGANLGRDFFLEQLGPPDGAIFVAGLEGARLGHSVAGLPDRDGDLSGDFAIGAPGFAPGEMPGGIPGSGAAFEVRLQEDPGSPAPRNLTAQLVPGGRVVLTWMSSRAYRELTVHRDGEPISGRLPGKILRFTDVNPGPGRHVYLVEADENPDLRSNPAEVHVREIGVRGLACRQLEGRLRIRVSWAPGDVYKALQVFVNGRASSGVLDPNETSYEFDAAPGEHRIEVFNPLSVPEGVRTACTARVSEPDLPSIRGFQCAALERNVTLTWDSDPAYGSYVLFRNRVLIAVVTGGGGHVDDGAPRGLLRYELLGVNDGLHRSPPALCETVVIPGGAQVLRGRVRWLDGGPLRHGSIRVTGSRGEEAAAAQVGDTGEFEALAEGEGPYRVQFDIRFEPPHFELEGLAKEEVRITVEAEAASLAETVEIDVPPPVLLVDAAVPDGAGVRWGPLQRALAGRVPSFALVAPAGIARGAEALGLAAREVTLHLGRRVGSPPPRIDIVAYGFAGLAARVHLSSHPEPFVRRAILCGTPNLGTARAHLEARAEFSGQPLRSLDGERGGLGSSGAPEQTPEFLAEFNRRVSRTGGAEVHLVAGNAGLGKLEAVLGCAEHDDRVCVESALGGVPGAVTHRVAENHESLGRGAQSIALLLDL
ncbi:MAG TPA: integrin alpha, partial [Planctomycetota bacterium]|nr:integrin alpha [Planctomycetota bacterium]